MPFFELDTALRFIYLPLGTGKWLIKTWVECQRITPTTMYNNQVETTPLPVTSV